MFISVLVLVLLFKGFVLVRFFVHVLQLHLSDKKYIDEKVIYNHVMNQMPYSSLEMPLFRQHNNAILPRSYLRCFFFSFLTS